MEIISILERIYERHYGLFCKIGCEIYGLNKETTYDLIHDSFIKVFKNRNKIKSESEPGIRGSGIYRLLLYVSNINTG